MERRFFYSTARICNLNKSSTSDTRYIESLFLNILEKYILIQNEELNIIRLDECMKAYLLENGRPTIS